MRRSAPAALAALLIALPGCPKGGAPGAAGSEPVLLFEEPAPRLEPEAFLRPPAARVAKARALVDALRDALIREDIARAEALVSGGDLLSSVGAELVRRLTERGARFRLEPLCPAGDGLYVRFVAIERIFSANGHQAMEMYAGPDTDGVWRLFPAGPRDAIRARLVSETAHVRVDPAHGTVSGRATMTIETGGERWVPISLDLRPADPEEAAPELGGFALTGLEVDGTPGRFQVLPGSDVVVAELSTASTLVTVRMSWEGAPGPRLNYVKKGEVLLHEAQPWLPLAGGGLADYDVTVEHPRDFEMLLENVPPAVETRPGWVAGRSRVHSDMGTTVFGRPRYARRRVEAGSLRILLAVSPDRTTEEIDDLEAGIRATHAALSVLGEPPARHLRIVESTPPPAAMAVGGRSFIALGPAALGRTVVAHELGHSWFGGLIPNSFKGEWGGQWPESLAEYVVTWTLDEARARTLRAEWADCYAPLFRDEEPLKTTRNFMGGASRAVLYCKGPLLLAALERRIGRPALQAALARFVRERANTPSTWDDIARAVGAEAGTAPEAWLRTMLARSGAPTFELERIAAAGGLLKATLRQRRSDFSVPDISEEVELVFLDPRGAPVGPPIILPLTARTAEVSVPIPNGATVVEIDPERRYPWKRSRLPGAGRYPL